MKRVAEDLVAVTTEIKRVQDEIKEAKAINDEEEKKFLMEKEKSLMEKERLLMEEKRLLMEKEKFLMEEKKALMEKEEMEKKLRASQTVVDPISFTSCSVGGETMFVGALQDGQPLFLSPTQHAEIQAFVMTKPSGNATVYGYLLVAGVIKSGKSEVVRRVIPSMAVAAHNAGLLELPPVFFQHAFSLGSTPEESARSLVFAAEDLATQHGFSLNLIPGMDEDQFLDEMPFYMQKLSDGFRRIGKCLWILWDEMQAPILNATTPASADKFVIHLKDVVE